jgi:hypothetical protein
MTPQNPQISPDGAYWWDGQAWRPMPLPGVSAPPIEPPTPQTSRPSWLPDDVEIPGAQSHASAATPAAVTTQNPMAASSDLATPVSQMAPPPWVSQAPPSSTTRTVMVAAVAAIAVMVTGAGVWAWHQMSDQSQIAASVSPSSAATPSSADSPRPSPTVAQPLTAQLGGEYCPVAHPGDAACWKGSFLNTGPAIAKLAMIFITDPPYADWYAHHANGTLSGYYTSPGCDVDPAHSRIVCGAVSPNAQIDVYLGGDVTTRGTFNYAVKFADISSGSPSYVNQHVDGTHDVVSWREVIT